MPFSMLRGYNSMQIIAVQETLNCYNGLTSTKNLPIWRDYLPECGGSITINTTTCLHERGKA